MSDQTLNLETLAQAFDEFNRTTQAMEEAYRRLEVRVKDLDRELAVKNQELELTTDYLNSTLQSMSDGVIAIDTNGSISTFNRAAATVLGYEPGDLIGAKFDDVFDRSFSTGTEAYLGELTAKDGTTIRVSERDSPLSDNAGADIGMVKVFQDLSEIETLRERLRQKDRLAAIGEMAATVAHEIRNPLGGIRGFASLLRRDLEDDDPKARLVDKVLAGAQSLDRVVGELLEYTRPVELRRRDVNCADLVESAIGYLQWDEDTISITRSIDESIAVNVDADKLRQVLLNMLLNSVQAMDGGGQIEVKAINDDGLVILSIEDNGAGMSEEELAKAFMPFYTTKEKGTGLGLAAASKIIEAHGGRIEAACSDVTTFTMYIPGAA